MSNPICIYHANCADGFGAAWAVWKRFPDWEFFPGVHQKAPPEVSGRDVVMVDFSYKRPVLEEMKERANSILVLDHHKSAAEDLDGFFDYEATGVEIIEADAIKSIDSWLDVVNDALPGVTAAWFDMEHSGAVLAWRYFHPVNPEPALLRHIEDRDLWRFALPQTREVQAALFSYPYEFDLWDELIDEFEGDVQSIEINDGPNSRLAMEGQAIERKHHKDVAELVSVTKRDLNIEGYIVPIACLPYTLASDAGHLMAEGRPFAACYWDTETGRTFSLRSVEDGLDVSEIAAEYGGGGHKHAAGFAVPRDHPLAKA